MLSRIHYYKYVLLWSTGEICQFLSINSVDVASYLWKHYPGLLYATAVVIKRNVVKEDLENLNCITITPGYAEHEGEKIKQSRIKLGTKDLYPVEN